jgi:predicted nucleic acid-binding protein
MRAVLDANVLFPTILRELLLEAAAEGGFEPVWSARILEEWARATRRLPEGAEATARIAIGIMRAAWPEAEVEVDEGALAFLSLPDPDDRHVLAAAIAAGAEVLVTSNRADFPARTLARHGVTAHDPDGFLTGMHADARDLTAAVARVHRRAEAIAGEPRSLRAMLRRAGLTRLAKALDPPGRR